MTGRAGIGDMAAGSSTLVPDLVRRCLFPPARTAVCCAVSGGADSTALLVLAVAAGLEVEAFHVDHGLRPGSQREGELVRRLACRLGVGFRCARVTVRPGPNLEARARAARYAALPDGVLTGHTADDQAETVLLNLLRGAGTDGLAGMRPHHRVRRPLLGLRRSETRALCHQLGLAFLDDPTNAEPRFTRSRVRSELLGLLEDIGRRDPVPVLTRQASLLADDAALLDELAAGLDPTDARSLAAAPVPLARRALRRWLRTGSGPEQHPPSAADIERVLAVARGASVACELSGGRRVERRAQRLLIVPSTR